MYQEIKSLAKFETVLTCLAGFVAFSLFNSVAINDGQAVEANSTANRLANQLQPFVDQKEVAGLVAVVADRDHVLDVTVLGNASIEPQIALKSDSIFWIASMSKPVTGACVMMMVDEGKVALDDPIDKYLPEFAELKTEDGKPYKVAVRQLMNHTSGLREIEAPKTYSAKNLKEAIEAYSKLTLTVAPGTKWQYSQTSINTAARIVEVVSRQTFDKFVQERVCKPLGMKDTGFYLTKEQEARLATSYSRDEKAALTATPVRLLQGKSPSDHDRMPAANGGLFSTANDYLAFCQMLLGNGTYKGQKVLTSDAVTQLRTVSTGELTTGFTQGNGWGVGCCVVREPQGATESLSAGSFGHGGAYGTQAWIDPMNNRIYLLMVQRANFPNADNSDLRRQFQKEAKALTATSR